MSAITNQPDNINYLSPLGFRFILDRTPTVNYFVQQASVPGVTLGEYDEATPLVTLPYPGTKLSYAPLDVTFRVDEDARNYDEIYKWLIGLGFPESSKQYAEFSQRADLPNAFGRGENVYSDGSMVILTSQQNPNLSYTFKDMFPISISPLTFDTTQSDVTYLDSTVSFRYSFYTLDLIK